MAELEQRNIYAHALAMPKPENPKVGTWIAEILKNTDPDEPYFLVGHSLGANVILHYLAVTFDRPAGVILVSCPIRKVDGKGCGNFLEREFDFDFLHNRVPSCVIHGTNDPDVPFSHAEELSAKLGGKLVPIENGGHLNGHSGHYTLPECLDELREMIRRTVV